MLAIAGGKGGVGKTTTALGIGVALRNRRRDPLVVDADVDTPNLHLVAGTEAGGVRTLADGGSVEDAAEISDRYGGLRIVGAHPGAPVPIALRMLVTERPVVLDSPAGGSRDAVVPLRHADHAIVVTTPDPESIQDSKKTARMARAVDTEVVAWIVNRTATVPDRARDAACGVPAIAVPEGNKAPLEAVESFDRAVSAWVNA